MSVTTNSRRRWTETTIETELRIQIDALGHFPTRAELVSRGNRGLWDAMRSAGGVDAWRQRLEHGHVSASSQEGHDEHEPIAAATVENVQQPPAAQPADDVQEPAPDVGDGHARAVAHERIEVLAYELYEKGAPGSPLDHWLEAERTLA